MPFPTRRLQRSLAQGFSGFAATLIAAGVLVPLTLQAAQLRDGTTVFESPPRLVDFMTTRDRTSDTRATYYITVNLLPEAGEPLQTLTVTLAEGRFQQLAYRLGDMVVFRGDRQHRGETIPIAAAQYDQETQVLTIDLQEPIQPGEMVTFGIKPVRNPYQEGVYLFEVAALPAGDDPVPQRVGTGRIQIYRPDGRDPFDF